MKKGAHERAPPPAGPPEQSNAYLRLAADFDNFRKRTRRDAEQQAAAEKESFIRELLPVLDSLDRARASGPDGSLAVLHQGVEQTWQQLDQLLRRHGIEAVDAVGQPFDPHSHEAVSVGRDPHQPDQVVLEVAERGYRRGDLVFRAAKVIVNDLSRPPGIAMPVEFKDYYAVLGVARDANDAEIKKAFRNLAREYHPDVAKDKVRAEGRFKEINEANEVLSDPDKRRKYDELGAHWNQPGRRDGAARGGFEGEPDAGAEFHFEGTGFSDFFEQFFGSRGRTSGGDFGHRRGAGPGDEPMARRGQDIEGDLLVTLDEALRGSVRSLTLQRIDPHSGRGATQTLQVKIPPGIREGQLIRLAGQGQAGAGGGTAGHLYLRIKFAQHPAFRVRGADLHHDLDLSPWEAVLGCTVDLPTLDGVASLTIPAGTAAERQFRLRGKGLPRGDGARGDLYAVVAIQVPSPVSPDERALWEHLATKSKFNPRSTP